MGLEENYYKQISNILTIEYGHLNIRAYEEITEIIEKREKAISVTRCCELLKDKKAMTFEEYIDNYYERKDFKYVNKRGKAFKSTEISQIYDEHIHNL